MGTLRACAVLLAVAAAAVGAPRHLGAAAQPLTATPPPPASETAFTRVCFPVAELEPRAAQVAAAMEAAGLPAAAAAQFSTDVTSGLLAQPWLRDDSDDEGGGSDDDDEAAPASGGGGGGDDDGGEGASRPPVAGVATSELLLADPSQPGVLCWKQEVTAEFIIERYIAAGGSTIGDDSDDDDGGTPEVDDRMAVAGARGGDAAAAAATPATATSRAAAASAPAAAASTAPTDAAARRRGRRAARGPPPQTLRLDLTGLSSRRICPSCCNLSSFEQQFRLLRRCACRLCRCTFDCR